MIKNLDGIFETVTFQKNIGILIHHITSDENFPDHWHNPMEIIHVTANWYKILVNDRTYLLQEGDIAIIRPGTIHALFAPETGSRTIYLADLSPLNQISSFETLLALLPPVSIIADKTDQELHKKADALLASIEDEYAGSGSFSEVLIYSSLMELLGLLGRSQILTDASADTGGTQSCKYAERMLSVCSYINDHCTEELTLSKAADLAGFSKYHFTRLFKDFAHTSFYKYLNKKRISHAEQLLINPDYSITEVALHSGFSSLTAFIRMFKQLKGCTPTQFRKLYSLDCMNRVSGEKSTADI